MQDIKAKAVSIGKAVFPRESGRIDLDESAAVTVRRAIEDHERIVLVPDVSGDGVIARGDICIPADIDQYLAVRSDSGILMYSCGRMRYRVLGTESDDPAVPYTVTLAPVRFTNTGDESLPSLTRELKDRLDELSSADERYRTGEPLFEDPYNINEDIDYLAGRLRHSDKMFFFKELDTVSRALKMLQCIKDETEIDEIDSRVHRMVQAAMDDNQREYYVREQIKALSKEIDEEDESESYLEKIDALKTSEENKEKFRREVRRLGRTAPSSPDMALIKNYLDTVIELPWGVYTDDNEDLKEAERVLNEDHYGLEKVKERLIEALAVRKLSKEGRSPIICLVGPPGVGKTSIAQSIAKAMNKKYVRLSFGGIRDEAEIRGHRKTYVGAMPGRIITSIMAAGSMNPVFLMDEIDKMASDYKGDPASALLEVLDPEQNKNFRDHFLEVPFDLSKVLFITTANTLDTISRPLLDRMEVIELSGYTDIEKKEIAKRYLVKKALAQNGVSPEWMTISEDAIMEIIHNYTRESGVRALEKGINAVVRKVARAFVEDPAHKRVHVTVKNLEKFLGEQKYPASMKLRSDEKGVVTGLAWTETGGDTLEVEVAFTEGKGDILLTGNLGDVMKESARIAISYCRAFGEEWGIPDNFFATHDVHIHVPEGATPKDGPSAGITIATAVCSAASGKPVRGDVAMTGELTLRGKVLPIGGLKEKSLAAMRDGIKTIFLPEENRRDYRELPELVKKRIDFRFVDNVGAVLRNAIVW